MGYICYGALIWASLYLCPTNCQLLATPLTGGGGWVHPKCPNSMAVSWLNFKETLVGTGWAIALLLCTNEPISHTWYRTPPQGILHCTRQLWTMIKELLLCNCSIKKSFTSPSLCARGWILCRVHFGGVIWNMNGELSGTGTGLVFFEKV